LASDGDNYLAVWTRGWDGPDTDIYGARVDVSGNVLDSLPIPISSAISYQDYAAVVFDGNHYLVVWEDRRDFPEPDIYGARVTTSGTVLDPSGLELINASDYYRMMPAAASAHDDQVLLAFEGFVPGRYNSYRTLGAFYTGVGIEEQEFWSGREDLTLRLHQNTPNPFESRTAVRYHIPNATQLSLRVYDSSGRLVKTLDDGNRPAGSYSVTWDGSDGSGSQAPSGIYFCRLQAGDATATRKMILLR
jgi:hypothetical protein